MIRHPLPLPSSHTAHWLLTAMLGAVLAISSVCARPRGETPASRTVVADARRTP